MKHLDYFNSVQAEPDNNVNQDFFAERTERWRSSYVNFCSFWYLNGRCRWNFRSDCDDARWEGQEGFNAD